MFYHYLRSMNLAFRVSNQDYLKALQVIESTNRREYAILALDLVFENLLSNMKTLPKTSCHEILYFLCQQGKWQNRAISTPHESSLGYFLDFQPEKARNSQTVLDLSI